MLLFAFAAAPARGFVENSPHDLIAQGYDVTKTTASQDRCSRCHLRSGQSQKNILPEVPPVLEGRFAPSSLACFSCHDGTTIVSPDVDASMTAFHPLAHGTGLKDYPGIEGEGTRLPATPQGRMECVTCHDPHDNDHRPFLRMPIADLCLACHSVYAEIGRGRENRSGNHLLAPATSGPGAPGSPIAVGPEFRVPFPAPYPLQRAKATPGVHWDLGGHLLEGAEGALACVTCHAVHGGEGSAPRRGLLAKDPENEVANLFCEGCHAGERGDAGRLPARPNPGGTKTGRTYHPVDDDLANGPGRIVEVTIPPAWPLGGGEPAVLLCTTCHAAHKANPSTPLLRAPVESVAFCESCHAAEALPPHHHPAAGGGACAQTLPPPAEGDPPGLSCVRCHRAHNAGLAAPDEKRFIPLLRQENEQAACAICHPADNPTCGTQQEYRASHFLGDPVVVYEDPAPPLRRDPWPETGLRSSYGQPESRAVTCFSCHAFRKGALVSSGEAVHQHLVARSGPGVEWAEGEESVYLCAGCHSVDPSTGQTKGHSHPMMKADATKLEHEVEPPATVTPEGRVNCDSCHRPHEALTRGGYYILESVDSANADPRAVHPMIDFTVLCHTCHDPGRY